MAMYVVFQIALRMSGEPVWARELADSSLHKTTSIHHHTNLKRRAAFFCIRISCYVSLSNYFIIQSTARLNFETLYVVIWQSERCICLFRR